VRLLAGLLFIGACVTSVPVADVAAQRAPTGPRIELRMPSANNSMSVAVRGVLSERAFDELLRSGFPTRLHFRAELWTVGQWFDNDIDRHEWDLIVRYDVIERTYEVVRVTTDRIVSLGIFNRFADARSATEIPFAPPLALPTPKRKNYYNVQVEVQTIELKDLDEVQRWLRGEARPAVQGRRNPGTALTRGVRTLISRILGGQVRHLEQRSPVFDY
jgi:hypothetical protein